MNLRFLPTLCGAAILGGVVLVSSSALASTPLGAYAKVEKVTYEPDAKNATKVRVDGVFALNKGQNAGPWAYTDPTPGYMYFTCPGGSETECRLQWADFEKVIGTKTCAGFGQDYVAPGTVRPAQTSPANPDTYALGMGVLLTPWAGGTCDKLQNFKPAPIDDGGVPVPDAGTPGKDSGAPPVDSGTTPPVNPTNGGGGGCSVSGSEGGASALPLLGLLGFVIARRRRKA